MAHEKWTFRKPYLNPAQSSLFYNHRKSVTLEGSENLTRAIDLMPQTPLITVSTHTATIDDVILWSFLPLKYCGLNPDKFRWVLGAQELTYDFHPLSHLLFSRGQVIPVVRGLGIYQAGMDAALDILNEGGWVHIFSEGRVYPNPQNGVNLPLRWGIARLIMECKTLPVVIPIIHKGAQKIKPLGEMRLGLWNDISVRYGKPIPYIEEARATMKADSAADRSLLTQRIANTLIDLYVQ